jgi:hypothetical protein
MAHKVARKIKRLMKWAISFSIVFLSLGTAERKFLKRTAGLENRQDPVGGCLSLHFPERKIPPKVRVAPRLRAKEMDFACEGMAHNEMKRIAEQIPNPVGTEVAIKNRLLWRIGTDRRRIASAKYPKSAGIKRGVNAVMIFSRQSFSHFLKSLWAGNASLAFVCPRTRFENRIPRRYLQPDSD